MSASDLAQLEATAYHEAGHAAVAEHCTGAPARIELWRAGANGSTWIRGRCHHVQGQTYRHRRLISLAGAVAETLAGPRGANSGDALLNPILSAISAADAANAGSFDRSDVDDCLRVVRGLWAEITLIAQREIQLFRAREAAGLEFAR